MHQESGGGLSADGNLMYLPCSVMSFFGNQSRCASICWLLLCPLPSMEGWKGHKMKNKEKQKPINEKQFYILVDGEKEFVTEEIYRAYMRPEWAEHQRKERAKRCRGKNGHRCMDDCNRCSQFKMGADLSLEALMEEDGYEAAAADDVAEAVMYSLLLEKLYEELEKLEPTDELILHLFGDGKSERETEKILRERSLHDPAIKKMCQKTICNHKNTLFRMLRERLEEYR